MDGNDQFGISPAIGEYEAEEVRTAFRAALAAGHAPSYDEWWVMGSDGIPLHFAQHPDHGPLCGRRTPWAKSYSGTTDRELFDRYHLDGHGCQECAELLHA